MRPVKEIPSNESVGRRKLSLQKSAEKTVLIWFKAQSMKQYVFPSFGNRQRERKKGIWK